MVCSSVEAISIRFLVREKLEKNSSFFKFCVGVEDMRTIWTMSEKLRVNLVGFSHRSTYLYFAEKGLLTVCEHQLLRVKLLYCCSCLLFLILIIGIFLLVASEDTSTPPASPTGASEAPSTSESGDTSSTDTGEAELSLEQQHRVSLIWSLLTCESPAEVLSDDATKRLDELERCLAQKEEELNFLRDESSALTQQVKNLEIENTAVRSHCGTLKQENAALIRQYSNVKMTKDKEPEVMTNSFAIMPQDILMFGKTLGSGNHASQSIKITITVFLHI